MDMGSAGRRSSELFVFMQALGLALLAGCQHGPHTAPGSFPPPAAEPNVRLSQNQVADVQAAFARTLEQRGEIEPAIQAYTEALKNDPKLADACVRLAALSARQGQFAESAELYARALKLQPNNPDIYCDMGYTLYLQDRWTEAVQTLRQCLTLKPDHQRAHNNLGLVQARTGRDAEALQEFRLAGCSEADARVNLAYAQSLNGTWPDARRNYEEALALQPSSEAAKKGLANLTALTAKLGQGHGGEATKVVMSEDR
jgi:Flp pilus assembly protein TadD